MATDATVDDRGGAGARPPRVLHRPSADVRERSRIGAFLGWLARERGLRFDGYDALWRWSTTDLEGFWSAVAAFFDVRFTDPPTAVLAERAMPGARWFPGATLNYAEHLLAGAAAAGGADTGPVLLGRSQTRGPVELDAAELHDRVARARRGLQDLGVGRGDRVVAYLPNVPETLVAFLATASLGAVWSSCAPEFGTRSVVDRFGQIEPTVLLAIDGYRWGERAVDRRDAVAEIRRALPTVRATVHLPYLGDAPPHDPTWDELVGTAGPLEHEPVPFDHPLYVLYSSGTTGRPKAIVHGHGGILLEHLKALGLHGDLGPGDRFGWYTSTGWMMWNYLVSGLAVGSSLLLFDGDPGHPDLATLWRLVADTGTTAFGVGAPFLVSCRKAGLRPGHDLDLHRLRWVGSTGAPLPAAAFEWVYDAVGSDLELASISGGTDVCTAFAGGCPLVPVWAGEISCRMLGAAVAAYDDDGREVVGEQGELVLTEPMPSMPVGFWGDDDGSRLRAAYFADYPGAWRHGDWITVTERGSCVISGRSDATLNRGGIRVGTAEYYAVVDAAPEVRDSLVVHLEDPVGGPGELLLFLAVEPGTDVDALADRLRHELRDQLSPRHVPDVVEAVPAIPRTLSGKKLEVPVKRILAGADPEQVASRESLADPGALDAFVGLAARRRP